MAVRASSAADPDPAGPRAPIRTCIGCRQRAVAAELLRVVVARGMPDSGPVVVPESRRRLPGRGAWLHPVPGCFELAERRRAFARALRVPGSLDLTAVRDYLTKPPGKPTGGTPQEIRAMGTR